MTPLKEWESFYVIVGSSGGALIGLQFVVITLIADRRYGTATAGTLSAFGTPTVVHFVGALLLSAIMSIPWPSLASLSIVLGMCGLVGLVYGAIVIRRARHQKGYEPVWEDWIWYAVLPCVSYATLSATAALLHGHEQMALVVIGAVALALLLIGIHNAWDAVTHLVVSGANRPETKTD